MRFDDLIRQLTDENSLARKGSVGSRIIAPVFKPGDRG
jgi:hypothetical protein